MNRSFFSKTKNMIGVGLKKNWLAHTYQNYPKLPPEGVRACIINELYIMR